jgi:hypothetical protein
MTEELSRCSPARGTVILAGQPLARRSATMKYFKCNPLAFVQSLTKSQRKALTDVLQFPTSKDFKQGPAAMLRKALEGAK